MQSLIQDAKTKAERCIHCLRTTDSPEADHVFPKSWYPDTTPPTVQRWTVPSCPKSNRAFGQLEKDLLLRIIPCIDPNSQAIAGLKAKVLRTLGFDTADLEEKEQQYREALLKRFRSELIPSQKLAGQPGKIPGLGPPEGVEAPWSIPIRLDGLSIMAEKLARGCEFKLTGRYVEDPYEVVTFIREADFAEIPDEFKRFVESFDFGPGCRIQRISVPADPKIVRYRIAIWNALFLDVIIDLKEEIKRTESAYSKAQGIDLAGRPAMQVRPYLRDYQG